MIRTFVIRGKDIRELKKKLYELKRSFNMFHHLNDIDIIYGGGMDEKESKEYLDKLLKEINEVENKLKETNISNTIWTRKN